MINAVLMDRLYSMAQEAIIKWGAEAQIDQAKEELAELSLEFARIPRNRHDDEKIIEEVVDNFIMMIEMGSLYGWEEFNNMLSTKLIKFQNHLNRPQ